MSQPEGSPPEFNITPKASGGGGAKSYAHRKRRRMPVDPMVVVLLIAVLAAGAGVGYLLLNPPDQPVVSLTVRPIADKAVKEHELLIVDAIGEVVDGQGNVIYWLAEAPEGASLEADSGRFTWEPTEAHGSGQFGVTIVAALEAQKEIQAETRFVVSVTEDRKPPTFEAVTDQNARPGEPMTVDIVATDPDKPAARIQYQLGPGAPAGAKIDPNTGLFVWKPDEAAAGKSHAIMVEATEAGEGGQSSQITFRVAVAAPPKPKVEPKPVMAEEKPKVEEKPVEVAKSPDEHGDEVILELFEKRKLFHPSSYKPLRTIFAKRFEMAHDEEISAAWGEDDKDLREWFGKHGDIKEEFYTALDPEVDDIPAALKLMHEMWKLSPGRLAEYGNLAIAVAVTWDKEQDIYDYGIHQLRTRSTMPEELAGALDNYKYIVRAEKVMQGRGQFLPWEFLVHVVNHKTPLVEREWAVKGFLPNRAMIGECYGKVPYDTEMASTSSTITKLQDKPYNLPNILALGGVCAMQADFASRVGKCLGVPAAYVGGESRFGGLHAWVMWVELKSVTQRGIAFTLESFGRYRGDHYYVGNLTDSKSGEKITDRQLELRLHTIGMNPVAKRQSDLIMAVYPMLRDHHKMEVGDQLAFLDQLIRLCPGNEAAWRAVATMSREGLVPESHAKMMAGIVNGMFVTFAAFPDFTWEIFDDLIAYEKAPEKRALLYSQLMELYVRAGRPDLSCTARLKFTDYLVEQEQAKEAIQGLAAWIMLFPEEGRYVPPMLDRLEELCGEIEGSENDVMNFYRQFLPKITTQRGSTPSQYCMDMYQRAIGVFRKYKQEAVAQQIEMQLAALKAMGTRQQKRPGN